jgi:hypothetical protein
MSVHFELARKEEATMSRSVLTTALIVVLGAMMVLVGAAPPSTQAASHREAPLIALDPTADISDFFMFRSYEADKDDKIVLIMDVIPGEEPSSGPNYWNFDPNVRYEFHIDNDKDGKADISFEFQFKTEIRGVPKDAGLFLSYVALPPITALDGTGSEGLGLRQTYKVTMVDDDDRTVLAEGLFAVPSNVGPRTMPDYNALTAQGIYDLGNGIRVFAGQRDDPFYIDLGAIFDTLNLRAPGVDMLSGFNVHTIALEVPASLLTKDGKGPAETDHEWLGAYAATSRQRVTVLRDPKGGAGPIFTEGRWVQVQRLANPLVNETIIPTANKDRWNRLEPHEEAQFEQFYLTPRLALALELVIGLTAAKENRTDLRDLLLTYPAVTASGADHGRGDRDDDDDDGDHGKGSRLAELLRLDISVPPKALGDQQRLTVLAGDNAGWPNGRRPIDDVTDVAVQVVGGSNYITAGAGDAVNVNDLPLPATFPFLSTPWDGRNRVHANP